MAFRFTPQARQDAGKILAFSLLNYGEDAAKRYELLIKIAATKVAQSPDLYGSVKVDRRPGVRSYALAHCRKLAPPDQRIANPAHKLVYCVATDGVVEILAIVGTGYPAGRTSRKR